MLCADGVVGSNNERSTIRTPMLGGWHMVTITTMTNGNTVGRLASPRCMPLQD